MVGVESSPLVLKREGDVNERAVVVFHGVR